MAAMIRQACISSFITLLVGALVGGCAIATVDTPDQGRIPDGPLEAQGGSATGPLVELGRGRSLGIGWRYAIYPSADGWCTQLELTSFMSSGCGDLLPPDGAIFGGVSANGAVSDGPLPADGLVSAGVTEVWLETTTGARVSATLMPLAGAGLDGKAFLGFAPSGTVISAVIAVGADGRELEVFDLP